MTGRIIPLRGDDHLEALSLLPWYVTGRLDGAEQARLEAHLSACAECQADLGFERRLSAEIAALPVDVEQGWTRLRGRLDVDPPTRSREARFGAAAGGRLAAAWRERRRGWRGGPAWLGWALAAQAAMLLLAVGVLTAPRGSSDRYHALGAARAAPAGNAVVIFRPDTPERDLRAALRASHARLVDGPTAADAYVIHVPAAERAAALETLRGRADLVLAEPIDAGGPS